MPAKSRIKRRFGTVVMAALALSGCFGVEKYGEAVRYLPHIRHPIQVVMPPNAPYIAQEFSALTLDNEGGHLGIDIWGPRGLPVIAAAGGVVTRSYYGPMYGHVIVIQHGPDSDGVGMKTEYKHLDERRAAVGDRVRRGQEIGTMGDTGLLSALVHLHFEVQRDQRRDGIFQVEPHLYWADGVGRVSCFEPGRVIADVPFRTTYPVPCK